MKDFTALFVRLDRTSRTTEKVEALTGYFRRAAPEDAAWFTAWNPRGVPLVILPKDR